jgi:acyl carrier protein
MTNLEKYDTVFTNVFGVANENIPDMQFNTWVEWDSVAHMQLVAAIEDAYNIMLEMDDIVEFVSYKKGKEILSKYSILFD